MVWKRYWKLKITKEAERYILPSNSANKRRCVFAICDCWTEKKYHLSSLKTGNTKSCWCEYKESNKTHWMQNTKIYNIWSCLKNRCNSGNKNYWWRWITYEKKWETFEWFYKDMGDTYKEWLSIERIDVNWNYNKKNCKWIKSIEQAKNRRTNVRYTYKWKTQIIEDWKRELNIPNSSFYYFKNKWMKINDILDKFETLKIVA